MGSVGVDPSRYGIFRFSVPDLSLTADERGLFSFPANTEVKEERLQFHDARMDTNIVQGPKGLDVQGFTYIEHRSALSDSDQWTTGQDVEERYIPEVEELICRITGAKRAVVNNVAFRQKLADMQVDHKLVLRRGNKIDLALEKVPKNVTMGELIHVRRLYSLN